MMKGLSEMVSTVMLVVIVMAIAAFVSPWALGLVRTSTNQTTSNAENQMTCQNSGLDFDNNYGTNGLVWNFTGTNATLKAKVINTGTINLYSFTFDITINNSLIYEVSVNSSSQKTQASPLKPGQSAILVMNSSVDYNDSLTEVAVRNGVCLSKYIDQKL